MDRLQKGEYEWTDIVQEKESNKESNERNIGIYEGKPILMKKGKYGWYAKWGTQNISLSSLGNRPIENIECDEVIAIISSSQTKFTRKITDNIDIRQGEYGEYIFYKTPRMKQPKVYKLDGFVGDYKKGNPELVKRWIQDTYQIR